MDVRAGYSDDIDHDLDDHSRTCERHDREVDSIWIFAKCWIASAAGVSCGPGGFVSKLVADGDSEDCGGDRLQQIRGPAVFSAGKHNQ